MQKVEALAILLTSSLLEWLRELPARRALHMLKLITELLRKHGEGTWSGRLQDLAGQLRLAHDSVDGDRLVAAVREVLACFTGTGSLQDVHLSPEHGHKIKPEEVEAVNARASVHCAPSCISPPGRPSPIVEWPRRRA